MSDDVERVLRIAREIPAGQAMTYGEIGRECGVHPRRVGRIVAQHGDQIPWWRIVRADGTPAACHDGRARALLEAEGATFVLGKLRPDRRGGAVLGRVEK